MNIILTLLILSILVVVHEYGHYITARIFHVKIVEFAVGMGPVILSRSKNKIKYSLRALPFGGFNRFADPLVDDEDVQLENGQVYLKDAKIWQRTIIFFAGSLFNIILAAIIVISIYFSLGVPASNGLVGSVMQGSPAQIAGIKENDIIIAVDGLATKNWESISQAITNNKNESFKLDVLRNNEIIQVSLTPQNDKENNRKTIGVYLGVIKWQLWDSIKYGIIQIFAVSTMMIKLFIEMIIGKTGVELMGPVGMISVVGSAVKEGLVSIFSFAAILSMNFAVINLFPLPALDGSKILLLGVEKLRGKALPPEKEGIFHLVGFAFFIILTIIIAYKDIVNLIK
ncbi:MAG: RIP metalloprotease RseP [Clostridia bacterium]